MCADTPQLLQRSSNFDANLTQVAALVRTTGRWTEIQFFASAFALAYRRCPEVDMFWKRYGVALAGERQNMVMRFVQKVMRGEKPHRRTWDHVVAHYYEMFLELGTLGQVEVDLKLRGHLS